MMNEVRAAGLIVFRQFAKGKPLEYLLLQTSYGEHHWTPPKGHVDPGEDEKTTAIRETQEEAGLGPSDYIITDNFACNIRYNVEGREKSVTYWLAELKLFDCPVKLSEEHQALRWLEIGAACDLVKYNEMQDVLHKADKFLLNS